MPSRAADRPTAPVPRRPTLRNLDAALPRCRACDPYEGATQPVRGKDAAKATLMLVGEQPGDRENIEGHRIHQKPDRWPVTACLPWPSSWP